MSDEYSPTLRQADQARADFAAIADDLDFIGKRPKEDDLKISSYPRFHARPLIRRIWDLEKRSGAMCGALLAFAITSIAPGPSHAATPSLTTLVNFNGTNGWWPVAGLIADASGNLFGTTFYGGAGFIPPPEDPSTPDLCCWPVDAANGAVFEIINTAGGYASTPANLLNFNGTDGFQPAAGLTADASGNLFGTTAGAGVYWDGTVFEIAKTAGGYASAPITLVSFNGTNGASPEAGLIADSSGNLFGTTMLGGAYNDGTVFEIVKTASGYASTPTTLVSFNGTNGSWPAAGLIADSSSNLFGTTSQGGAFENAYGFFTYGTVFEIVKTASGYASTPTTLVSFNGSDGMFPASGLIADAEGNLFGTTSGGGANGQGTVFEIAKTADGYASAPTTLVNFNGTNGASPEADLIADRSGNLFGTTMEGGAYNDGAVFEVTDSGFLPPPLFAGTPGRPNCHGRSVGALARQYGGLNSAAAALGYPSVRALQKAILEFCEPDEALRRSFRLSAPSSDWYRRLICLDGTET